MDIMSTNSVGSSSANSASYTFNIQKNRDLYASPGFKKDKDGNPLYNQDGFLQFKGSNPIFMGQTKNEVYTLNVRAHKKEFNELTNNLYKDMETLNARKQELINEKNKKSDQMEMDSTKKLKELEKLLKKKHLSAQQKEKLAKLEDEVYALDQEKSKLSKPVELSKEEEKELASLTTEIADLKETTKLSPKQLQETTGFKSPTVSGGFVYATLDLTKFKEQNKVQQAADAKAEQAKTDHSVKTQREAQKLQNKADELLKKTITEEESPYAFHVLKQVITEKDENGNTKVKLDKDGKPMQRFYLSNMDSE